VAREPEAQWIVPLSGRWFVETMDGARVEMGPGEVSLGNDQHSKVDAQGRRGHRSRTVGGEPAKLIIVQLAEPPAAGPCPFKRRDAPAEERRRARRERLALLLDRRDLEVDPRLVTDHPARPDHTVVVLHALRLDVIRRAHLGRYFFCQ
jgi:hypothetical protein